MSGSLFLRHSVVSKSLDTCKRRQSHKKQQWRQIVFVVDTFWHNTILNFRRDVFSDML